MRTCVLLVIIYFLPAFPSADTPFFKLEKYPGKDSVKVSFEVSINKSEYSLGDSVKITAVFRNLSENRGVYLWTYFWQDCNVIVKDETGRIIQPHPIIERVGPVSLPGLFWDFGPKQFWGKTWAIAGRGIDTTWYSVYTFKPNHTYMLACSLSVHRRERLMQELKTVPPEKRECINHDLKQIYYIDNIFDGDVVSNTVKFRISK